METIIQQLENQLALIDQELAFKGYTILDACPFIVGTSDGVFTVKANEQNQATIEFGNADPTQFSPRAADDLVKNFKPSNGHGPLKLVKMSRTEFIQIRKAELEHALAMLKTAPEPALRTHSDHH